MTAPMLQWQGFEIGYPSGFSVGPVEGALGPGLYHLVGSNGSGKTTLFRGMCGEWRPSGGSCRVLGVDTWRVPSIRARITMVSVKSAQPEFMTVDECWQFAAAMRGAPDWDGHGLREALGIRGDLMVAHGSAGQLCKAELLAALAGDPVVLLLDEVFANLDAASRGILGDWLEGWRGARVVLLTGHQIPDLDFDASWEMRPGAALRLARDGDPAA